MIDIVFDDDGRLIPLVLDASVEELHSAGAITTDNDVEIGAARTDHVRPTLRTFVAKVVVSPTPLATASPETVELKLPRGPVQTEPARWDGSRWLPPKVEEQATAAVVATILRDPNAATRVPDAIAVLDDALERSLLATVTTPRRVYENCALIGMTEPRTNVDVLETELTFKQLRFASSELVDDPLPDRPRDRRPEDKGAVEPEPAPPHLTSLALQGVEAVRGFFGL